MNLGKRLEQIEKQRHELEPTFVSYNSYVNPVNRERLKKVAKGLRDYRLHVLHEKPRIKWKRFKTLKLFE